MPIHVIENQVIWLPLINCLLPITRIKHLTEFYRLQESIFLVWSTSLSMRRPCVDSPQNNPAPDCRKSPDEGVFLGAPGPPPGSLDVRYSLITDKGQHTLQSSTLEVVLPTQSESLLPRLERA